MDMPVPDSQLMNFVVTKESMKSFSSCGTVLKRAGLRNGFGLQYLLQRYDFGIIIYLYVGTVSREFCQGFLYVASEQLCFCLNFQMLFKFDIEINTFFSGSWQNQVGLIMLVSVFKITTRWIIIVQ
jgi:hypothetical protein